MRKSHSSTSSSKFSRLSQGSLLTAFLAAVVVVGALELVLRTGFKDLTSGWDYWSPTAASKYLTYLEMRDAGSVPPILVTGESTSACGFSPVVFNDELKSDRLSYNIGVPGNFSFSFETTFNRMILEADGPHPEVLIAIVASDGFRKGPRPTEESILSSPIVQRLEGQLSPPDLLHISRLWGARMSVLDFVKGRFVSMRERGLGWNAMDCRVDSEENNLTGEEASSPVDKAFDPDRFRIIENMVRLSREKGIEVILVHPPVLARNDSTEFHKSASMLARDEGVIFWDFADDSEYREHMGDRVHLDQSGAELFSRQLARRFMTEYPDYRHLADSASL